MKRISRIFCVIISFMLIVNLAGFDTLASDLGQNENVQSSEEKAGGEDPQENLSSEDPESETESQEEKNQDLKGQQEAEEKEQQDAEQKQQFSETENDEKEASTDELTDRNGKETDKVIDGTQTYVSSFKAVSAGADSVKLTWNIEDPDNVVAGFDVGLYLDKELTEQTGVLKPETDILKEDGQTQAEATIKGVKTGVNYYAAVTAYGKLDEKEAVGAIEALSADEAERGKAVVVTYAILAAPTLTAKAGEAKVTLSWSKVSGAVSYKLYLLSGSRLSLVTNTAGTSYTHKVSKNNVNYQYVVKAVSSGAQEGTQSKTVTAKPKTVKPGKVSNFTGVDGEKKSILTWSKVSNATSYYLYRYNSSKKKWTMIKQLKTNSYYDRNLKTNKTYKYRVAAVRTVAGQTVRGDATSTVSVNIKKTPGTKVYPMKYKATVRSKAPCFTSKSSKKRVKYLKKGTKVTTINSGNGRYQVKLSNGKTYWVAKGRLKITSSVWTTKDYSNKTKLNFINSRGYSSKTKYLIWISQYTQRVVIFEGKKRNWKINRSVKCATGTYLHKTPKGLFKITYKEKGWFYRSTYEKPIVHFKGANSFHSRIKKYGGGYADATIGRPKSKGCVRLYDADINFIYKKCPKGTTVVSY